MFILELQNRHLHHSLSLSAHGKEMFSATTNNLSRGKMQSSKLCISDILRLHPAQKETPTEEGNMMKGKKFRMIKKKVNY